jgi:anti-sigma factor RsiW
MISEDLEFQISQYADGTLSAAELNSVEALLQSNPQAREMLAEYRQVDLQLGTLRIGPAAGPVVRWDEFAGSIADRISDESGSSEAHSVAGRIGFAGARWRIAAAVLVCFTGAIVARHAMHQSVVTAPVAPTVVEVAGPQVEIAKAPSVQDVSVGPSAAAMAEHNARYGEGVITQGTPKVILGQLPKPAADPRLH